jgi:hypothetical protein
MASEARKQLFMKHKASVASFVEQATGKRIFYVEGSVNSNAAFAGVHAGDGASIREPAFGQQPADVAGAGQRPHPRARRGQAADA